MENEDKAMLRKARDTWSEVGDCELTSWRIVISWFSKTVMANGQPAGYLDTYRHVFVFSNGELQSILRDGLLRGIYWWTGGQATQPHQQFWSVEREGK